MTDLKEAARVLAHYAKQHHAGAFATPMLKELEQEDYRVATWGSGDSYAVAAWKPLTTTTRRRDFTGANIVLPAGSAVITHFARAPRAPVPDLSWWDYVTTYPEDGVVTEAMRRTGRVSVGTQVSAASEIRTVWGGPGQLRRYPAHDLATITELPWSVPTALREPILGEVASVNSWHDDFPFYSDGSWSAVSLRGFNREDPTWGIKPSEMPRAWKAEHPEALAWRCDWTVLAEQTPTIAALVDSVDWWGELERVRLLRMAARQTKDSVLSRHTDITDRAAGTADGQIVRFHIPLVTHPSIVMHGWTIEGEHLIRHLEQWHCYYLDARKPHAVTNPSPVDRVHLVVDVRCDPDVRRTIGSAHLGALAVA